MQKDQLQVAQALLAETREDIAKADQKATMVLAALGIGVGAVLGGVLAGDWKPHDLSQHGEPAWWIGVLLIAASILAAGIAVWPRFDKVGRTRGIYYWANVAAYADFDDFIASSARRLPPSGVRTLYQLFHLSKIVDRKYTLVRYSMGFALAGIVFCVVGVAVGLM